MKINDGSPFSKRLKEARAAKGFSQKQLGIQAGIDQDAYMDKPYEWRKAWFDAR